MLTLVRTKQYTYLDATEDCTFCSSKLRFFLRENWTLEALLRANGNKDSRADTSLHLHFYPFVLGLT